MQIEQQSIKLANLICEQEGEQLWALVSDNNFKAVIELLSQKGIQNEHMGEILYAIAQKAASLNRLKDTRTILFFLAGVLEDKNELPPILSFIGDTYISEGHYDKARDCFGQLPITFENIIKIFNTSVSLKNLDQLLIDRDEILSKLTNPAHIDHIHEIVNSIFMRLANDPKIKKQYAAQYAENLKHLEKIDPSAMMQLSQEDIVEIIEGMFTNHLAFLSIFGKTYISNGKIWKSLRPGPLNQQLKRDDFQHGKNIAIRCSSLEQLMEVKGALSTDHPEYFKFQCYLITDFKLLQTFMMVEDLSALVNCDFVIKIVSEKHLDEQFHEALIKNECHVPEFLMHFNQKDILFKDKKLIPVLKKYTNRIHLDVTNYEKQIKTLFPDNYHNIVIQKIRNNEQLHILFQTSRYTTYLQHSIRDMAEGFKEIGCHTFIEKEKKGGAVGIRGDICRKNLIDFQPDIIFNINHLRHEYPWIPPGIPFITWVQDLMPNILELSDPGLIGENDFLYTLSTMTLRNRLTENPILKHLRLGTMPIGFNSKIYYRLKTNYKYDVTHISHLKLPKEYYQVFSGIEDNALSENQLMFRHLINYTNNFSIQDLSSVWNNFYKDKSFWKKFKKDFHKTYKTGSIEIDDKIPKLFIEDFMIKILKSRILKTVIDHNINLHLFGEGWEMHPWFKDYANGPVENGPDLNRIQNESKINLNISIGMLFHPKFSEVTGGGNFCINLDFNKTDYISDQMDFLNSPLITWADETNLVEKLRYFLENNEERERTANLLQKVILKNFSSKALAEKILHEISDRS